MSNEINLSEVRKISDSLYKGFMLMSTVLKEVEISYKSVEIPNRGESIETYLKNSLSDFVLKKIFGKYSK